MKTKKDKKVETFNEERTVNEKLAVLMGWRWVNDPVLKHYGHETWRITPAVEWTKYNQDFMASGIRENHPDNVSTSIFGGKIPAYDSDLNVIAGVERHIAELGLGGDYAGAVYSYTKSGEFLPDQPAMWFALVNASAEVRARAAIATLEAVTA